MLPAGSTPNDLVRVLGENFYALDRFFLGLTQGRRPRAGAAFELVIRRLFVALNYPFSPQPIINGQPDFILPSVEYFRRNPMDAIIFTVKRTLRERWRQIVTEGTRGMGFFLATIDEAITPRDLKDMLASRIYLVVPTRIKAVRDDYANAPNVITFENFFVYHLDPAIVRWRAAGVI
ncbi:MAG: type II restriction endonuclease [Candidatus Korobacteraceae bacterium]